MKARLKVFVLSLLWACTLPAFGNVSIEQIHALVNAGQIDAAAEQVASPELSPEPSIRKLRLRVALLRQDYLVAEPLVGPMLALDRGDEEERELVYMWLYARDDRAEVARRTRAVLDTSVPADESVASVDLQAAGRLALELLNYDRAEACFLQGLQKAKNNRDKAAALKGLGQVAYKRLDFDSSLTQLNASIASHASADGLMALAESLIRLARTDEAIAALERAVRLNPYHERAHYFLGNGYARKNYTELAEREGSRLVEAAALVRRASDVFEQGDYRAARELASQALGLSPQYGRAHNALAKALQFQRAAIDVHRADYERRFGATPMPDVPGIEKYVLNWAALSPRHQKRVALSVAPWKAFVPVLLAGGSSHYIKPLYMKLSETPGLETLKDQRINTDSRLWDDVRGAGGFATVTGIEDVEQTIFDKYNTVLHELTHQVHQVLTANQAREIQEHYRRAKEREVATRNAFLSRYASGTVWEYFAEGVNALASPQRDDYDPREEVLQRLQKIDPDLLGLVTRYVALTDVKANLPIAYLNAGNDQLGKGNLDTAMVKFERAREAAPRDETVLVGALNGLAIKGDRAEVVKTAQIALALFPASGDVHTGAAEALWHIGRPLSAIVPRLAAVQPKIVAGDRHKVDLALAEYYRRLGDVRRATRAYDLALGYQSDNPEALSGKAATLALVAKWDEAFPLYERAIRLRTGVVDLRADYARDLLRAGRLEQARMQLDAARLLDPTDPTILALDGWFALLIGDPQGALTKSTAALDSAGWNDVARLIKGSALKALGRKQDARAALKPLRDRIARNASPSYVYRASAATWISVHELPAVERRLLADVLRGL